MPASLCTYRQCYCCSVDLVYISPLVHINLSHSELDPLQTVLPLGSSSVNFMFTHRQIHKEKKKKKTSRRIPQGFAKTDLRYTVSPFICSPESCASVSCLSRQEPYEPFLVKMHAHLSRLFRMYTHYPQLKRRNMHSMHRAFQTAPPATGKGTFCETK